MNNNARREYTIDGERLKSCEQLKNVHAQVQRHEYVTQHIRSP